MKKTLSVIAGALLAGTLACTQPGCLSPNMAVLDSPLDIRPRQEYDAKKDLEDILKAVHCVKTASGYVKEGTSEAPDIKKGYGTAFAYAYDGTYTYLLTNVHVVSQPESVAMFGIEPKPTGGWSIVANKYKKVSEKSTLVDGVDDENEKDDIALETVAKNKDLDIAIVRAKKKLHVSRSYITDYSILPVVGDEVYVTGFPRGLFKAATKGMVSHPDIVVDKEHLDIIDVTSTFGNSGSPYFIRRGENLYWAGTVGKVLTYKNTSATLFTIGTPIRSYYKMLKEYTGEKKGR